MFDQADVSNLGEEFERGLRAYKGAFDDKQINALFLIVADGFFQHIGLERNHIRIVFLPAFFPNACASLRIDIGDDHPHSSGRGQHSKMDRKGGLTGTAFLCKQGYDFHAMRFSLKTKFGYRLVADIVQLIR